MQTFNSGIKIGCYRRSFFNFFQGPLWAFPTENSTFFCFIILLTHYQSTHLLLPSYSNLMKKLSKGVFAEDIFPDPLAILEPPIGHFGLCRRCGVTGGEWGPLAPLGWYYKTGFKPLSWKYIPFSLDPIKVR